MTSAFFVVGRSSPWTHAASLTVAAPKAAQFTARDPGNLLDTTAE